MLAGLLLAPAAARAAVLCPAERNGQALRQITLFDGPPAELASLVPDQRGRRVSWEVAYIRQAGRRAVLVCGYGRNGTVLEMEVPAAAQSCFFALSGRGERAGAVECR